MTDINNLRDRYFVQSSDVVEPGERVPDTSAGNRVTYFIDGPDFFKAIREEITTLSAGGTNRYFYMSSWWLGLVQGPASITRGDGTSAWQQQTNGSGLPPFQLPGASVPLIDQLAQMSTAGVDVRVLPWVSHLISSDDQAVAVNGESLWLVDIHSILSANELRKRTSVDSVVLNTIGHPLGALHVKVIVCGDNTRMRAYTSGLDVVQNRLYPEWHDAGVRVEGPAATAIYSYFRLLWNEQVSRRATKSFRINGEEISSHRQGRVPSLITPSVPERVSPAISGSATQHIQVLRTAPQMHFSMTETRTVSADCKKRIYAGFSQPKWDFAQDGIFEFKVALEKAISAAENYIYIEDQCFWSFDVMDWINDRMKRTPALKVILLYGADPADQANVFLPTVIDRLIQDIPDLSKRVVFYEHNTKVIHSKVTIIDDRWVAVGSANCMRRSLYTDGELSVGILDEGPAPSFAQRFRRDLWLKNAQVTTGADPDILLNIDRALGLWNSEWATQSTGITLLSDLQRMNLPFEYVTTPGPGQRLDPRPSFDQTLYDQQDPDSRQEF